jgi:proteasome accessory factor C
VSPWEVFSSDGSWYLAAGIDDGSLRNFRLDRMEDLVRLGQQADPAPGDLDTSLEFEGDLPLVELDVPVASGWLIDTHPVVSVKPGAVGRMTVTLAIAGTAWLERLLLRLGPEARVVAIDPGLGDQDVAAATAERLLARYRSGPPAR